MAESSDPFSQNIIGVTDLVENKTNKVSGQGGDSPEGIEGDKYDALEVKMTDEDLLKLRDEYEKKYAPYEGKLKPRVEKIKESYLGKKANGQWIAEDPNMPIAANLQFEAEETFLAAALAKNPEPVVYCDNSPEGNAIANSVKTMLAFHADQLVLRRKLALMVRQWSMNLLGVLKPGWNPKINDVTIENRKIQDYVFDPDGHVDAYGDFSSWFGERITVSAERLAELFPKHKDYIQTIVETRWGTQVTYTEWWPNDEYCFYTFKEKVLDKHKNQFWKYEEPQIDPNTGQPAIDPMTGQTAVSQPRNHFAHAKKPGVFLSVYSLQEQPHDITGLVEQNIPNQNLIARRTDQLDFNASAGNNAYAFSEENFNQETGKQAANARRKGNPILIPAGGPIDKAIMPLPAEDMPAGFFNLLEINKNDLRTSWGVQGVTAQPQDEDQTARGMILNQSHDTSRIGGGIGDAVEQVADNAFNWLVQLYYVFYDEPHFAAIMGNAKAVEYVTLSSQSLTVQLIVSVSPDSLKPKDEVTQMNLAQALFDKKAIGPKTLLKMLDFPNPDEAAADGVLYAIDPATYFKLNFPEEFAKMQQAQMEQAQQQAVQGAQAKGMETAAVVANTPPEQANGEPQPPTGVSTPPTNAALSNVPLNLPATP